MGGNFERFFFSKSQKNPNDNLVLSELQKTENFVSENFSKVPEQGSDRLFQKRASNGKLDLSGVLSYRSTNRSVSYHQPVRSVRPEKVRKIVFQI